MLTQNRRAMLLSCASLAACAHDNNAQEAAVWEHKMISSGSNRPDFRVQTPANTDVLVALHEGEAAPSNSDAQVALTELRQRGFVQLRGTGERPAVLVASLRDGPHWFEVRPALVAASANLIAARAAAARELIAPHMGALPWPRYSFFLLSDVLLDSWQIGYVEQEFVRAERPQRSGGRYYYALLARAAASDREPFGIYGNQFAVAGDIAFGVYGNRRVSAPSLVRLSPTELATRFGVPAEEASRGLLVSRLAEAARGEAEFSAQERAAFMALDVVDDSGGVTIPVLSTAGQEALDRAAQLVGAELVALLNAERALLRRTYDRSPYAVETTFEEYLIWWYHFYYTVVTDELARRGELHVPASGITSYILN